MNPNRKSWFLLAAALLLAGANAQANPYETTLPNGMRVIVKEDHRSPTVVHMVWYHVGAIDEKDGTSGLAHALEHMMFKGTAKVGPGQFSKLVAALGGRENAFTSEDYTAYFQLVPKRALPEMMRLEADRMANLKVDPKEFAQEIKVVMEERRMRTEDEPQALVQERLNATAFQVHPYRRPVIGWMSDLEHMSADDVRGWHHDWYTPNNAYLVVVGDVNKDEVFKMAAKYYGGVKRRAVPASKALSEPEQVGVKRIVVKAPAKLPYLAMLWKVPKLVDVDKDREPYALEVLANVLDGNDAARLSKDLLRAQKIAVSAGAGYESMRRGEATFEMDGQPAEGKTVADLEAALRGEIKRVQDEGISPEELARIKTQTIANQVYKRDSLMAQAMEIGAAEASGHRWQDIDKTLEKIRSVTADEVQAVAKKYFKDDTLTVAVLDPQPLDSAKPHVPSAAAAALRH
jgi:zinc protease